MTAPLADRIRAVLALADASTPGPWSPPYYDPNPGDEGWWIHNGNVGSEEFAIAHTFSLNRNGENDAAFIAAAPEMAALLRECLADDRWRPISEAPLNECVLICAAGGIARTGGPLLPSIAARQEDGWYFEDCTRVMPHPTHFRPLPAAPGAEPPDASAVPEGDGR